ncbi:ABC transporter permease [Phreatobacter stygius]|uniref:ABC transporter permease n=2 Tax=Phreatobacter stygius TaxID=1940610 RepID=A0A4D7AV08_9HYPH|nr:ABC transporter permease [Phreatobacter stygius]
MMDATTRTAAVPADAAANKSRLSPLNQRRLANFRANGRGFWSFRIFMVLFVVTLFAELIANDRPLYVNLEGQHFFPVLFDYSEKTLGGEFETPADYKDAFLLDHFEEKKAFLIWPLVRNNASSTVKDPVTPFPSAPTWMQRDRLPDCAAAERLPRGQRPAGSSYCALGNWNWLGTDDQGRDVVARVIYGFRISVLFGLTLTIISSLVGVAAGAVQGYFGGWTDLLFQRFIEIWTAIPSLYLLLIISSVLAPSFFVLLGILLLFSWVALVGVVRAEFLRARNFEYVNAARALGVSSMTIMTRHLLPNAMVATVTFLPFVLSGSVMTLTALDFLGFGLPVGSPSLGELLQQGKSNLQAPWLALTAFITVAVMLSLLIFVGEAVRDAFDPRKTFT